MRNRSLLSSFMLSFWGLFRGKRTWISREDQGTCILSQANDCGRVASPMAHLFVSSLPGTMTPRSIKCLDIFGLYSDEQRTVIRHTIHLLFHCVKKKQNIFIWVIQLFDDYYVETTNELHFCEQYIL